MTMLLRVIKKHFKKAIEDFNRKEPIVLLELALWKAACLLNPPESVKDLASIYTYFNGVWKGARKKCAAAL